MQHDANTTTQGNDLRLEGHRPLSYETPLEGFLRMGDDLIYLARPLTLPFVDIQRTAHRLAVNHRRVVDIHLRMLSSVHKGAVRLRGEDTLEDLLTLVSCTLNSLNAIEPAVVDQDPDLVSLLTMPKEALSALVWALEDALGLSPGFRPRSVLSRHTLELPLPEWHSVLTLARRDVNRACQVYRWRTAIAVTPQPAV